MARASDYLVLMGAATDAWNGRDLELLAQFYRQDVVVRTPGRSPTFGIEEYLAEVRGFHMIYDGARIENHPYKVQFASGSWTCFVSRFTGQMTGPRMNFDGTRSEATGRSFDVDLCAVARWNAGLIVEKDIYYDTAQFASQLGFAKL